MLCLEKMSTISLMFANEISLLGPVLLDYLAYLEHQTKENKHQSSVMHLGKIQH